MSGMAHVSGDRGLPTVQVTATLSGPTAPSAAPVEKIVVAVHGVGDQHSFATIQAVVNQFCVFHDIPAGVPLGSFHDGGSKPFSLPHPYPQDTFARLAFAEVYWAKYPREVVNDRYMLEESKKWARTIVERLRLRWQAHGSRGGYGDKDFRLVNQVLAEMIDTVAVLDRICYLAEKAGVFTFDLRKLLDDYLGDVQIVAEFGSNRAKILKAFDSLLLEAHTAYPEAEIYLIAHSEGTVVSLLGLLQAFRADPLPPWAGRVRGLMTIGSPIDKHLLLWPELFDGPPPAHRPEVPIHWRNYYDYGDPIGFDLDDTRTWIAANRWTGVFDFPREHDHGFVRYPLPGKAHVDYWNDKAVFGHFIETVVKERPGRPSNPVAGAPLPPPGDHALNRILSFILPYVGVAALILIAVFILYKAVAAAVDPAGPLSHSTRVILVNVLRNALVVFGITVAARVPRLTRDAGLRGLAVAVAVFACTVYVACGRWWPQLSLASDSALPVSLPPGITTTILAGVVIGLSYLFGAWRPGWGAKPLLISGTLVVAAKVVAHVVQASHDHDTGEIWPVFMATAAFLYLWWLAALIFDLTLVWHWYIRRGRALRNMDDIMGRTRDTVSGESRPAGAAAST